MIESTMFRRLRYLPALVLGALLLAVATSACGNGTSTPNSITIVPPSADVLTVGIVVPGESQVLNGFLYGDEQVDIVILSHMRPNDQSAWFSFAEELAEAGYAALTFDFRGYGISPGDQDFDKLDEDLAAAVSFMRLRGKERIFLVGASMGGTTSLVVAANENVAGVVAISAPAVFQGQNAVDAIVKVSAPTLLIAAEDDTAAIVSLEELLEVAGPSVDSETFLGPEHGTAMLEGDQADEVRARIIQFLDAVRRTDLPAD